MDSDAPPDSWDPRTTLGLAKQYLRSAMTEGASFEEASAGFMYFENAAQALLNYGGDEYSSRSAIYDALGVSSTQVENFTAKIAVEIADKAWSELNEKNVTPEKFIEELKNFESIIGKSSLADKISQTASYQDLQKTAEQIREHYSTAHLQKAGTALVNMYSTELHIGTGDSRPHRTLLEAAKDITDFVTSVTKYMKFSGLSLDEALSDLGTNKEDIDTLNADINMAIAGLILEEMRDNKTDPARQAELGSNLKVYINNSGLSTKDAYDRLSIDDQSIKILKEQAGQVQAATTTGPAPSPQDLTV